VSVFIDISRLTRLHSCVLFTYEVLFGLCVSEPHLCNIRLRRIAVERGDAPVLFWYYYVWYILTFKSCLVFFSMYTRGVSSAAVISCESLHLTPAWIGWHLWIEYGASVFKFNSEIQIVCTVLQVRLKFQIQNPKFSTSK